MKRVILILFFISPTLFSEPQSYHFINVPYGIFLFELPKGRETIFIPSFSRIEILEEVEPVPIQNLPIRYDSNKKIKYKDKIGYIPKSYIGTYNIISREESPDKSKYFEIISPYKNCDCNMYEGYIHSCFMEISSSKNSKLIKRIGNEKQKPCWDHYWRRAMGWFNEEEILVDGFSDGDAGGGDRWDSSKEKVNYTTGKNTQLYTYIHLSCKSDVDNSKIPLTELRSFNKIFIYWEEKIYESKVPVFTSSIKYDREADAYACKIKVKKMKALKHL